MRIRTSAALAALLLLLSLPAIYAASITVLSPYQKTISDFEEIDLGTIGPGQTISLSVEPKVATGGIYNMGGRWDLLEVTRPPLDWSSKPSKQYADPLQAELTAPADAPDGKYTALLTLIDENDAEKIGGKATFRATVNVSKDVLAMSISPKSTKVGANQPARFLITLTNTAGAPDVFEVSSSGIRGWDFRKTIYIGAGQSKQLSYEVVGNEEQTLTAQLTARSLSSDLIQRSENVTLKVETDLLSDYKATNNGLLIFPIIEQPVYSLMGLLSNLFG